MQMEIMLEKMEDREVLGGAWTEEEEEEEYPTTFDDTDDDNPPEEEVDKRIRGEGGGGGGVKIMKTSHCVGSVKIIRENEKDETETIERGEGGEREGGERVRLRRRSFFNPLRENEKSEMERGKSETRESTTEREGGEGGGEEGRVVRLRHRCFLNHCKHQERGDKEEDSEVQSENKTVRLKNKEENKNSSDDNSVEVMEITTSDDNDNTNDGAGCSMHHTPSPAAITTIICNSITPNQPPPPATTHPYPPTNPCHRHPYQNYPISHPCQYYHLPMYPYPPCLPCHCHKQVTAFPCHGYPHRCIPCQPRCPCMHHGPHSPNPATLPPSHNANIIHAIQSTPEQPSSHPRRYTHPVAAPSQQRRPSSPSFSKDYITSLAFLARVDHVARVLAERSVSLKDLPKCPSPALCVIRQQSRQSSPPSSHRHDDPDTCTHDLHRLQETLALGGGVGKGQVTMELRNYCRGLLLAVLCPKSPPHELLLVENSIQELEGRAFGDHSASQVKYCWRVASSLCLILERLGWVPSAL